MVMTFMASALWHGPRAGFFVMFTGFAFMEVICKEGAKTKIAVWIGKNVPYAIYHPVRWYYFYFTGAYLVIAFQLSLFWQFNFIHKNMYYACHWGLPLQLLIVTLLPKVPREKKSTGKQVSDSTK